MLFRSRNSKFTLVLLHLSARPAAREGQPCGSRETGQRLTRNGAVSQIKTNTLTMRCFISGILCSEASALDEEPVYILPGLI